MANSAKSQAEKKPSPQQEDCHKKESKTLRVGKYHDYTPLNVSLADLYKEVRQVE